MGPQREIALTFYARSLSLPSLRIGSGGASGHAPANTLASIWKARSLHVDFIEVVRAKPGDGHLVLLHDDTRSHHQQRTLSPKCRSSKCNGSMYGNWQRIPTLEEARTSPDMRWASFFELKA